MLSVVPGSVTVRPAEDSCDDCGSGPSFATIGQLSVAFGVGAVGALALHVGASDSFAAYSQSPLVTAYLGGASATAVLVALLVLVYVVRARARVRASVASALPKPLPHTRPLDARASTFAHEAKNALASMRGLAAHMARTSQDPKSRERLEVLEREAARVQELVEAFVGVPSSSDHSSTPLGRRRVSAMTVAREVAVLLEGRAARADHHIVVRGDESLAFVPHEPLKEALLNLLLNALDASPPGETVHVEVTNVPDELCIRVSDRGAGMAHETLAELQTGRVLTTKPNGSGVGLSVVRAFVASHGGHLDIESIPDSGSAFTMRMPCGAKVRGE